MQSSVDHRPVRDDERRGMQWLAAVLILLVLALATTWLLLGFGLV